MVSVDKQRLREFSASIKNLPPEERKAAGIKFQAMKAKLEVPVVVPKKKHDLGPELWSLEQGPFGYGMIMYENELHVGAVDNNGYPRRPVVITGTNLKVK